MDSPQIKSTALTCCVCVYVVEQTAFVHDAALCVEATHRCDLFLLNYSQKFLQGKVALELEVQEVTSWCHCSIAH